MFLSGDVVFELWKRSDDSRGVVIHGVVVSYCIM